MQEEGRTEEGRTELMDAAGIDEVICAESTRFQQQHPCSPWHEVDIPRPTSSTQLDCESVPWAEPKSGLRNRQNPYEAACFFFACSRTSRRGSGSLPGRP